MAARLASILLWPSITACVRLSTAEPVVLVFCPLGKSVFHPDQNVLDDQGSREPKIIHRSQDQRYVENHILKTSDRTKPLTKTSIMSA